MRSVGSQAVSSSYEQLSEAVSALETRLNEVVSTRAERLETLQRVAHEAAFERSVFIDFLVNPGTTGCCVWSALGTVR
jgi:hypothetical protein